MADTDSELPTTPTKPKLDLSQFVYHPRTPVRRPITQPNIGPSTPQISRSSTPSTPATPSKKRKKKPNRPFAPPETYEHLRPLNDCLGENMRVLFCGINPGITSATTGAHFAHPTNHFWPCIYASGFTTERMNPDQSFLLPDRYGIGITNLTDRPSTEAGELSRQEQHKNASILLRRIVKYRPRVVCFLGLGIWAIFLNHLTDIIKLPQPGIFDDDERYKLVDSPRKKRKRDSPKHEAISTTSKYFASSSSLSTPTDTAEENRLRRRFKRETSEYRDALGLKPFKIVYPTSDESPRETIFYCLPSTSARVVIWQLVDKIELFKQFKATVDSLEEGNVETGRYFVIEASCL